MRGSWRRATIVGAGVIGCAAALSPAAATTGKKPDLIVTSVANPPATVAPGSAITASDTVKNKGRKKAKASRNGYFLSLDAVRDDSDIDLSPGRSVKALKPRKRSEGSASPVVPASTPEGSYLLIVCADDGRDVKEKKESNNCRASAAKVAVRDETEPPDTTPPATPAIDATDPDSPANDNQPEVKGSGAEAGSTAKIYDTACTGTPIGTGTAAQFNGSGITVAVPTDATAALRATATDAAGNTSACSAPLSYIEDSTAPTAPTISDTDPDSPSDDSSPEVEGTGAEPGADVEIFSTSDCSGSPIGQGDASSFGSGGVTAAVSTNATTNLRATQTDAAGNVSACSSSFAYVHDSTAPSAPSALTTTPASPSTDAAPEVSGSASEGTVSVFKSNDCTGPVAASGTAAAFASPGLTVSVAVGTTSLSATATDAVGNVSDCSTSISYTATASNLETEPNGSAALANPMPANEAQVDGVINPVGDQDFYSFAVPVGGGVVAETFDSSGSTCNPAGTIDTVLRLFAPDGTTVLATDDEDGLNSCSKINGSGADAATAANLPAGTYFIRVTDFGDNSVIPAYRLSVDVVTPAEAEPNDAFGQATAVPATGAPIRGAIATGSDEDWFSFTVPAGGKVVTAETFDDTAVSCSGGIETFIQLFASNGTTELAADDEDGINGCSKIDGGGADAATARLAAGTYFIRVTESDQDAAIPGYSLKITQSTPSETEPNGTAATATPLIADGVQIGGAISPIGDQDYYSFTVPAGSDVTAETFDGTGSSCSVIDTVIRLFGPDGTTQLVFDDEDSSGSCSLIDGTGVDAATAGNLPAGTYFIRVEDFNNNTAIAAYRLRVLVTP